MRSGSEGGDLRIVVQPWHLKGAAAICEAFSISHDTLVAWARKGAPVAIVGRKYQADYHALLTWLVNRSRETDFERDE